MRRESGDPMIESWDHQHVGAAQWSNRQQSFGHLDYVMCNAVEDFQKFATHNVTEVLSQAGYSLNFYDQAVEGNLCFSSQHDHPDVDAPCKASYHFLKPLKAAMRANNPKAILMGEGWEMLSSQILDAGWVWVPPANPEVFRNFVARTSAMRQRMLGPKVISQLRSSKKCLNSATAGD